MVRVGLDIGLAEVKSTLQAFGTDSAISDYPSMLLGAVAMTPVNVAQIYQGLATSGFNTPLRTIREVTDAGGKPLSRYSLQVNQVADPAAVHLLQYAMQETMQEGTGRSAYNTVPGLWRWRERQAPPMMAAMPGLLALAATCWWSSG